MASELISAILAHGSARALVLIAAGTDLEATNEYGDTALHIVTLDSRARRDGRAQDVTAVVAALIAADANIHVRSHFGGGTPLHNAAYAGQTGVVRLLVEAGINVNARTADGCTPLHLAVGCGHLEACAELIRWSAEVNARNNPREDYWPMLGAAAFGNEELAALLLAAGADPSMKTLRGGHTAWEIAEKCGHPGFAQRLAARGLLPGFW